MCHLRKIFLFLHILPIILCYPKRKGVISMDDDLKLLLEQLSQNLNTVITNQLLIYQKLKALEGEIKKRKKCVKYPRVYFKDAGI